MTLPDGSGHPSKPMSPEMPQNLLWIDWRNVTKRSLMWPPHSPDANLIKHPWDVPE